MNTNGRFPDFMFLMLLHDIIYHFLIPIIKNYTQENFVYLHKMSRTTRTLLAPILINLRNYVDPYVRLSVFTLVSSQFVARNHNLQASAMPDVHQ